MRLGIDAREIQEGVYTGIGRALVNFLEYLSTQDNSDTCVLFSSKIIPIDFGPKVIHVVMPESQTFLWDQWTLPQAIKKSGVDLFYSPYYKIPLLKPCPTVSAILDLMYLTYKPYYQVMSPVAKLYYATFGRWYAHRADWILTCSQYSKQEIKQTCGVDEGKIKVIALSVAPIYFSAYDEGKIKAIKQKFNINGRYLLYMGNFKTHKNIALLIQAYARIAKEFSDVNLVLAGPLEHTYLQLVKTIEDHQLKNRVIFTGKIMESDEPQYLYQGAEVFVMPSLYEGFGIPPLEAMACGVPVVASQETSLPQIVGEAGVLVDAKDASQMAEAIKSIFENAQLKQELKIKGLQRAQIFESRKVAQEMADFFKTSLIPGIK